MHPQNVIVVYEERFDPAVGLTLEPVSAEAEPARLKHSVDFEEVELAFFEGYDPDGEGDDDLSDLFAEDPSPSHVAGSGRSGWLRRLVAGLAQPA